MDAITSSNQHGTYAVPQRFGISAILALTTLFAFVFAILKGFEAPAVVYLFFGTLGVTICLAQMFFGRVPRVSSIVSGALLLPFWVFTTAWAGDSRMSMHVLNQALIIAPFTLVFGAILGYLTGTVMAGFFLLLDLAQSPKLRMPPHPVEAEPVAGDRSES